MKDFDKFIFKGAIKTKPVFPIRPNPKLCQIWKRDLYEIRLSLLCGTMTFFTQCHSLVSTQNVSYNRTAKAQSLIQNDSTLMHDAKMVAWVVCSSRNLVCLSGNHVSLSWYHGSLSGNHVSLSGNQVCLSGNGCGSKTASWGGKGTVPLCREVMGEFS